MRWSSRSSFMADGLPTLRHFRQRLTGETSFDEARDEISERSNVFAYARLFERGHVGLALRQGDDGPRISAGGHHGVHQEARHTAVSVLIWMDVDENEMPEHNPHSGIGFFSQQIEEFRHRVPQGFAVQR